jgi:hypothetical protein
MRALLVRVGIDSGSGGWNAPVDLETKRFVFVPIPDCRYNPSGQYIDGGKLTYREEKIPDLLQRFRKECEKKGCDEPDQKYFSLPGKLVDAAMHLDPDFEKLTYGDDRRRGRKLCSQRDGAPVDFLMFYAGLRSVKDGNIVCALIGMLDITWPTCSSQDLSSDAERLCNAHSRWTVRNDDVVAKSKQETECSGLFDKCIPISSYRNGAHRVKEHLLKQWGGLSSRNGYIQRSGTLYDFEDTRTFQDWLKDQLRTEQIKIKATRYQVSQSQ